MRLLNNPDWCSCWSAESLLIDVLGMFAADWRTIFSFLFTPPFHVLLCFLPSWLCAVLHEVVLWVSLDGRKSERRVFRWGLLSGKRASSAGRASRGLQDLLFMRRVLLCKSLTVIPLMKWEYIFSCRFIWKCLKKKRFFSFSFFLAPWYHSCPQCEIWRAIYLMSCWRTTVTFCIDPGAVCWASMLLELQQVLTFHWANWGPRKLYAVDLDLKQNTNKKHKNNKESLLQVIMCLVCCPWG